MLAAASGFGMVKVGPVALALLGGFAPVDGDVDERGGLLVGRVIAGDVDGTCSLVVDTITPPMRTDVGTRTTFDLDAARHNAVAGAIWEESGGARSVLGTWHTHDELDPTPSDVDELDSMARLERGEYPSPGLLVIVGRESLGLWEVTASRGLRLICKAPARGIGKPLGVTGR